MNNITQQDVDWLSNVIREVDGGRSLGAGQLAEKIVEAITSRMKAQMKQEPVGEVRDTPDYAPYLGIHFHPNVTWDEIPVGTKLFTYPPDAAAKISALQSQVAELEEEVRHTLIAASEEAKFADEFKAQLTEYKKDAEDAARYRAIREDALYQQEGEYGWLEVIVDVSYMQTTSDCTPEQFDAAIDNRRLNECTK